MRVKQIEDLPMATSAELYQLSWVIASIVNDGLEQTITIYDSTAQLRTMQRRVKAWRSARVTEMVLSDLRSPAAVPAGV